MFDKWYDYIEAQIDRFIAVFVDVLFYGSVAGVFLLVIVQALKTLNPNP
jgi:hypothetical protein